MLRAAQGQRRRLIGAAVAIVCFDGMMSCAPPTGKSFCEAVEDGASNEELTLMLAKDGKPLTDGLASLIEDPPNRGSPCAYEVSGGKVVSAKVLR
jgi:hypothetical protein